jgi:hypothetical protein
VIGFVIGKSGIREIALAKELLRITKHESLQSRAPKTKAAEAAFATRATEGERAPARVRRVALR